MPFFSESWFWRGTQSAVFYYTTCTPCVEAKHKRKRRREGTRAQKRQNELVTDQPGMIAQPVQFQTNKFWAEEIEAGPGPPRGWKRDTIGGNLKVAGSDKHGAQKAKTGKSTPPENQTSSSLVHTAPPTASIPARPPLAHTHSTFGSIKDTLRSSIAPEKWNFKRYEREDEPLWGHNDTISRMWERATRQSSLSANSGGPSSTRRQSAGRGRRRADTADSDRPEYYTRARNPEINELHPPVVSQLPETKAECAWMLLPPPSRAVMEGKTRHGTENIIRKPLCRIASTAEEDQGRLKRRQKQVDPRLTERRRSSATVAGQDEGEGEEESDEEYGEVVPVATRVSRAPAEDQFVKRKARRRPQRPPPAKIAGATPDFGCILQVHS